MAETGNVVRQLLLPLVLLTLLPFTEAAAQERLVRRFAADQGLEVPPIQALAADREGALWIGTQGGLYRFDGVEFRRWAPDRLGGAVVRVAAAAAGRLAAQMLTGEVFDITPDGAVPHPAPPGGWPAVVRALAYDAGGRLWSVAGDSTLVWRAAGGWAAVARSEFGGEGVRRVVPVGGGGAGAAGGVLVLTDAALWRLDAPGAAPRRLFDAIVADVISGTGGRLLLLTSDSRLIELVGGRARELVSAAAGQLPNGRPIALVERKGMIWISLDRHLVGIREGREPVVIGSGDGLDSGGQLLVDHEGSLWLGGFSALFQFPEPETTIWYERGGMPGRHVRSLARSGEVLWVTSWQGTGRIRRTRTGLVAGDVPELRSSSRPCADSLGVVWLATGAGVARIRGDSVIGWLPAEAGFISCAVAAGPGLWIGTGRRLLYADARAGTLHPIRALPGSEGAPVGAVLEDRAGRLWIASGERACHAAAAAVRAARGLAEGRGEASRGSADRGAGVKRGAVPWLCEPLPGAGEATAMVQLDDGTLWLSTRNAGVLARDSTGWRPLPANASLATRDVFALVPSPAGGVWLAGHGILQRVRPSGPDGWEVLEAPGPGNGLHAGRGGDLLEDDDGTLWIATSIGLAQLPPEARQLPLDPPRVHLMDARVDAEPVPLAGGLELPADHNRLELRFAALSFREPGRVRYQVRLAPDASWVGTLGQPSFRWVDLPPGSYRAEVRASLDGRRWTAEPARFDFRVLPPWYRTAWALALFGIGAAAALWGAYRIRLAYHLGLERQRTRIAMDLHDELGSGLGSIGILAGLLPTGRVAEAERGRIAREIATTAAELGSALADIVWSLDPRTATLEELASRLAEHGERLFAGDDVEFRIRAPREWPAVELPLHLRRNILLIGLEALHNAARHARAGEVALSLTRRRGLWELTVSDDGVGLGNGGGHGGARRGRGLAGMRRRAGEIGATIEWLENPGGGTSVRLRFAIPGAVRPA